jgi:ATP-dependent DNA helicase DinG
VNDLPDPVDALAAVVAAIPGAEDRAGQRAMCMAVARALTTRRHLLVEAPTGTGKSVAYAVAAALHARALADGYVPDAQGRDPDPRQEHDEDDDGLHPRVVVTTSTKALQEQLCDEDLPRVRDALATSGVMFSYALLKGRANYLCHAKLDEHRVAPVDQPSGALFAPSTARERRRADAIARVVAWAEHTETGDRAELDDDVPDEVWEQFSTSARDCPGRTACAAGDRCLAERARTLAHDAQIIVVNTALYGAHLAAGGNVLPRHDALVLDEAHLAEDVFADQFGVEVHGGRLRHLATVGARLAGTSPVPDRLRRVADRLDTYCARVAQLDDPRIRPHEGEPAEILDAARAAVAEITRAMRANRPEPGSPDASRRSRADKAAQTLAHELGIALDPTHAATHVAWCSAERGGPARLEMMPVDVGELLAARLASRTTVVATSATLAVAGRFEAVATRFGLDAAPWDGLHVPSPFDFRSQALLYVPKHLPDPRRPQARRALIDELHSLIEAAGGRTLALFTSWSAMEAAADACATHGSYEVLRQGERPRRMLVDTLREHADGGGVAVFATMGFWTGVDVAGLGLSLVTIDRIPFPRPNDPLHAARRARAAHAGDDPFATVDVPRAAMLLAQGAGRLIRHRDDRGVVAVLDPRLATAQYRQVLLATMPPFRRTVDGEGVRAFLREVTSGAAGAATGR